MNKIFMLGGTPVLGQEPISVTYNLSVKERRELWPIVGEPSNPEISAESGRSKIHMLQISNSASLSDQS